MEKLVRFDLSAIKVTNLDISILGFNYLCYLFRLARGIKQSDHYLRTFAAA